MNRVINVSIVTVCFNSESTIIDTFESVLRQDYRPLQYIVIDGDSKDSTLDIIMEYVNKFKSSEIEYKYISEPDNGIYDAMNKGINFATGDIVGIINSDDWYEDGAITKVVNSFKQSEFDLFYADLRIVNQDGSSFIKKSKDSKWVTSRYWNHPTTFVKKDIYEKEKYRNETIHDDWDFILRIRKKGCKVFVLNEVLADFRRNGVSHQKSWKKAFNRAKMKYAIYRYNKYSRLYFIECYGMEIAKMVV